MQLGIYLPLRGDYIVNMENKAHDTPLNPEWKRRGRPPKGDDAMLERINIRVPRAMMNMIRDISVSRIDKPDKAVVIRELLAVALERYEVGG